MIVFLGNLEYNLCNTKTGGNMKNIGRPKGTSNKEIIYSVRIDQKTAERLNAYCESVHILKSEACREALDMLLTEKYERKKNYE